MYICPTCSREFSSENKIIKHFSTCWKDMHPGHVSKEAPRSENIITKTVSNDIMNFFNSFS